MPYYKQRYYLAIKSYCLGVHAFCASQSIDPILLNGTGENSRESIYLSGIAQAENVALELRQTRWEIENDLFGKPLTTRHDKSMAIFFTDAIDFAGLSKSDPRNSRLNILINPSIILTATREQYDYQPNLINFRFMNSLGEAIAHEEGHYKGDNFEAQRTAFGFEEVFVEYTSTYLPRKILGEIVNFRSRYGKGAMQLSQMVEEVIKAGTKRKTVLMAVLGTAHTGNLYEEYEVNRRKVVGFAKLYTEITGKSFFNIMDQYSNNTYNSARFSEQRATTILDPS